MDEAAQEAGALARAQPLAHGGPKDLGAQHVALGVCEWGGVCAFVGVVVVVVGGTHVRAPALAVRGRSAPLPRPSPPFLTCPLSPKNTNVHSG